MKMIFLCAQFLFYMICVTHPLKIIIPELCPNTQYLLSHFRSQKKTIVVRMDADDNSDSHMESAFLECFIRDSGEHSFTIISDIEFNFQIWKMLRRLRKIEPNIVIFTKFPTTSILEKQLINITLHSKWSLTVIIATTTEERYKCIGGKIIAEMFAELEKFTNNLWYNFRTINLIVYFPFVCPELFISYGNKTKSNKTALYRRSIIFTPIEQSVHLISKGRCKELTQDYPVRVSIFRRFPTSVNESDCDRITNFLTYNKELSNGYCGLDGLIMSTIVEYFGFNITKPQFDAANVYGYLNRQGRVTGTLGNIVKNEIDISFNSRFLTFYGVSGFNFLHYVYSDYLCAIVKRSDEVPLWLFPYDVYSYVMWTLLITTLTIVGIFLWLSAKCSKSKFKNERFRSFVIDSIITGLFGFSSMKTKFLVLKGVCFFSSVIFTAMFQSHVNYAYTTLVRYRQIDNLRDLEEFSGRIITSTGILKLINPPLNEHHKKLLKKVVIGDNKTYSYEQLLIECKDSSLGRKSDMILQTLKYYTDKNGQPLLHVVGECFKGFFLSFISNNELPFTDDIMIIVERLIEAGLPNQYYHWTQWSLGLYDSSIAMKNSVPRPMSSIYLPDLRIAFSILVSGYFISIIAFIVEKFLV